jgi:hypothetical protein
MRNDTTLVLAERGGFEPPIRFRPYTAFPVLRIRPLCHLSGEQTIGYSIVFYALNRVNWAVFGGTAIG